ncbi:hypothetical protein [Cytobacillus firmus]|uniref:Uncharacterized protein n=1 Tax=Cytobacillus firmus DS1 TaxID=1307436 RepID=W7L3U2_CYTFI|nr:hypothetical protein [Cytobacillus firmus]EWG10246.1 hypothetical protein PBF_14124 [Cytobacillus firmus DS1]
MPENSTLQNQLAGAKENINTLKVLLEEMRKDREAIKNVAENAIFTVISPAFFSLKDEILKMKYTALQREAKLRNLAYEKELEINKLKSKQINFNQYAIHIEYLNKKLKNLSDAKSTYKSHPIKSNKKKVEGEIQKTQISLAEVFSWLTDFYDIKTIIENSIKHIDQLLEEIEHTGVTHRQEESDLNMNIIGRWLKKMGWLFFSKKKEEQYKAKLTELQEVISQLRDELVHYKGTFEEVYDRLLEKEHSEKEFKNSVKELNDIYRQFIEMEKKYHSESEELNNMLAKYREKDIKSQRKIEQLESELHEMRLKENEKLVNEESAEKPANPKEAKMQHSSQMKRSPQVKRKTEIERNQDFERHGSLPVPPQSATTMFNPFKYSKKQ